jgi:hypothetical protein
MSCFSTDLKNAIVNNLLRGQALNFGGDATGKATASTFIGLFTVLPTGGGGGTEVTGGDYARVEVVSNLTNWAEPSNGVTYNALPIKFAVPSADWGDVLGVGAWSAVSGGTLLVFGTVSPTKTIISGQAAPVFVPGALILQVDI